jgi:hypothetical protein
MKPSQLTDEQLIEVIEGTATFDLEHEPYTLGKFSNCLCERLYDKSLDGWEDEWTGHTEWDVHVSRLGRFLVLTDDRGFVWYEEFPTAEGACARFAEIDFEYAKWEEDE